MDLNGLRGKINETCTCRASCMVGALGVGGAHSNAGSVGSL